MPEIRFKTGSGYFSGDISANDASFNNIDIEENLKVRNNLEVIGDICGNDASFNVVVWRRVIQGLDNQLVNDEFQFFIGGQNILPSGYEVYNGGNFNNRETTYYRWEFAI